MSKKFEYKDSKQVVHNIEIEENDFALVQEHVEIHDQKMQSKPTTFFKDAMKRFAKNKSSVVAACMLGTLVLLSIILPFAISSDVSDGVYVNNYQKSLYPKLFDAGTGWWDGCKTISDVPISVDYDEYEKTGEVVPTACSGYKTNAIVGGAEGITVSRISYENGSSDAGYGGYIRLSGRNNPTMTSPTLPEGLDLTSDQGFTITVELSNSAAAGDTSWNYGHEDTPWGIYFYYTTGTAYNPTSHFVPLKTDYDVHEGEVSLNLDDYREAISTDIGEQSVLAMRLAIRLDTSGVSDGTDSNLIVETATFSSTDETLAEACEAMSFDDANSMLQSGSSGSNNWGAFGSSYLSAYRVTFFRGSFRYDTYEDALGVQTWNGIGHSDIRLWVSKGWLRVCTYDASGNIDVEDGMSLITSAALSGKTATEAQAIADSLHFEILTDRCPFTNVESITKVAQSSGGVTINISGEITAWKMLFPDRDSCPRYLFGTDYEGKDLLKYVAEGLRTSLLLGVLTFIVCFTFGLVYGAIAGYYGGWTDILMERVTDILGGVPWIVVMTLAIIKWGSNFTVFVLALCFTGWIGTSSTTRTQFYRYKSREYILAARTLGASDKRLIFRHILPNAVGTIVTSSVLMIPSIIYSEATLAYLNLGLQGLSSFGVILSDNQISLKNGDPYMILFPSVVMALLMISFNLFGNGLRDAFNPSLKGAEN